MRIVILSTLNFLEIIKQGLEGAGPAPDPTFPYVFHQFPGCPFSFPEKCIKSLISKKAYRYM